MNEILSNKIFFLGGGGVETILISKFSRIYNILDIICIQEEQVDSTLFFVIYFESRIIS